MSTENTDKAVSYTHLDVYKRQELDCLNCPNDDSQNNEGETEDISVIEENDSIKTVSVKVNGKEVIQTTTGKDDEGSLTINKDGIIIKTK